jgi:predicted enzyme related to lactoylglutathione lyase
VSARLRIEIFVGDLDDFVDFYTRVLGFAVHTDHRAQHGYVSVVRGDIEFGASVSWQPVPASARHVPAGTELVIEVDDLDAEEERVTSTGWPIASPKQLRPWGLTDFRVHDPDGYYIRLTTRR